MANLKVVDADELDRKLSRIGDAVRGKTGGTELIPIDDIPAAIDGIEAGGGAELARQIAGRTVTEYKDEEITSIGQYAFYGCKKLETVDIPEVTEIGNYSFYGCSALKSIVLPKITKVSTSSFRSCESLEYADFAAITSIAANAFNLCENLTVLVIRTPSVCSLAVISAFSNTPFEYEFGEVYVPAALVDEYRAASNWSELFENETCDFYPIEGSEYE